MTSLSSNHGGLLSNKPCPPNTKPMRSNSISISLNSPNIKPQKSLTESLEICIPEDIDEYNLTDDIILNQPFHRIYIFDFDDTIFPTSILQKNQKIWNHTELTTINEYKQCHTLYITIKKCIDYILNLQQQLLTEYGSDNISFIIITNASNSWLHEICNNHSSLIASIINKLLSSISIISAKDEFESKYDDWYSECSTLAKHDTFCQYISSLDITDKIPIIYCIGDGKPEYEASKLAVQELYENIADSEQSDDDEEDEDDVEEDGLYLLYRIQLKTNRKSKNQTFKSLQCFWNILEETQQFIMNTDEELREILMKNMGDQDEMGYIIDYKL